MQVHVHGCVFVSIETQYHLRTVLPIHTLDIINCMNSCSTRHIGR